MKRAFSMLVIVLLSGCTEYKPNEYVITESKKCMNAEMDYIIGDFQIVYCVKPSNRTCQ